MAAAIARDPCIKERPEGAWSYEEKVAALSFGFHRHEPPDDSVYGYASSVSSPPSAITCR